MTGFMANGKGQIAYGLPDTFANGWANQRTNGKWHTEDRREMPEGLQVDKQIDFQMDAGIDSRAKSRMEDDRSEIEDRFANGFKNLSSLRCLASRCTTWHSSPTDSDPTLSQMWLFRFDYGISGYLFLFPVPFPFSNGRTLPFDDVLAEITCAREILSWEAQRIGLSLNDVLHRWATIASEEAEV